MLMKHRCGQDLWVDWRWNGLKFARVYFQNDTEVSYCQCGEALHGAPLEDFQKEDYYSEEDDSESC